MNKILYIVGKDSNKPKTGFPLLQKANISLVYLSVENFEEIAGKQARHHLVLCYLLNKHDLAALAIPAESYPNTIWVADEAESQNLLPEAASAFQFVLPYNTPQISLERLIIPHFNNQESVESPENLLSIISHDLKSPLNSLSTLLDSFINNIDIFTKEEIVFCSSGIRASLDYTTLLAEGVSNWTQLGKLTLVASAASPIAPQWKKALNRTKQSIAEKKLSLSPEFQIALESSLHKDVLGFLLRTLLLCTINKTSPANTLTFRAGYQGNQPYLASLSANSLEAEQRALAQDNFTEIGSKTDTKANFSTQVALFVCQEILNRTGGAICISHQANGAWELRMVFPS